MKKLVYLLLVIIGLFSACENDEEFPKIENITKGEKWTLKIGSTPTEVYQQLQALDEEKNFHSVGITHKQPYSKPEEIQKSLPFYNAITLENQSGRTHRAFISLENNKVSSVEEGGAMLDSVAYWPTDVAEDIAIHRNDSIDVFYQKLLEIYKISPYADYQIVMPNKPLDLPFDPDMTNYNKWAFAFSENVRENIGGSWSVDLFFDNGTLKRIRTEYFESEIYYD